MVARHHREEKLIHASGRASQNSAERHDVQGLQVTSTLQFLSLLRKMKSQVNTRLSRYKSSFDLITPSSLDIYPSVFF